MNKYLLVVLLVLATKGLFAEDFKTLDGKEYKNVTVSKREPDGITLTSSSGISKVYFTELPKEVQERFNYKPKEGAAYSAEQKKEAEERQKRQEDAKSKQENTHRLEAIYSELDQKEDDLVKRITKAEVGQYRAIANPDRAGLPALYKQLDDVRSEKKGVLQQLEQAQRQ
jgi:hypothetical protein